MRWGVFRRPVTCTKGCLMRPRIGIEVLLVMGLSIPLTAQTTRVSVDSTGAEANAASVSMAISADGSIVVFSSFASNLVDGDTNGACDVFVLDRPAGLVQRVSVDSTGGELNADSGVYSSPAISADGQVIAFESYASDVVADDTNGQPDVFVHDRASGATERVSVDSSGGEGNDGSYYPSISADGEVVAFFSWASNLIPNDTNGRTDVFVHDRQTKVTERVSISSSGTEGDLPSYYPSISADGGIVAFSSLAFNLIPERTNGYQHVYVHDRSNGTTELVSVDASGAMGNYNSYSPSISGDGQVVAFYSYATNLIPDDNNGFYDVYVRDRAGGVTERVSVDSTGAEANGDSFYDGLLAISLDGRTVAFQSSATNLVGDDGNGVADIFSHDRVTGITQRVSVDSSGAEGNGPSGPRTSMSADGLLIGFSSHATDLVPNDLNGVEDVFIHETCSTDASWSNYGDGFPGTNGIPSLTSRADPVIGSTVTLDLTNSSGNYTVALLLLGFQRAQIPTSWGGELLLVPSLGLLLAIGPGGAVIAGDIPSDDTLCGLAIDAQALEVDAGASEGVSFTPGLELVLGT